MLECTLAKTKPNNAGYASTWYKGTHAGAHVAAYLDYHGVSREDIKGLVVMHSCDNPLCINPHHLSVGTHKDNTDDKIAKGRAEYVNGSGEFNSNTKLTDGAVQYIRDNFIKGAHLSNPNSAVALAQRFGVTRDLILKVYNGELRTTGTSRWITKSVRQPSVRAHSPT